MTKIYRHLLLLIICISVSFSAFSTHIVGGALTYEHLGGSSYKVSLRLYRDCGAGNAPFETSAYIEVRRGNGTNPSLSFYMPRLDIVELDPPIDTCAFDPGICVEEAIFSKIVSLPPSASGYHLFHQTFARNNSLQNINNPGGTGEGFHTYIPNTAALLTNSSPVWTNFPPVFVCQGQDLDFDHSAVDPDGDSLVYSFYQPYNGRRFGIDGDYNTYLPTINGAGTPPDNITFPTVTYAASFSATSPLNSPGPALAINSSTGLINGIPQNTGQFVVGIKVEEWRNGQKIGVIVRDFQFNVVNCPPPKDAGISPVTACSGNTVDLVNGSSPGANGFEWDFGDGSPVSTQTNPTHTYPGIGDYNVQLIAQVGTPCADTAYYTLQVSDATSDFTSTAPNCEGQNINFSDNSTSAVNGTINSWEWDFDDGSPTSTVPNPSHTYNSGGTYDVSLIVETTAGCIDTLTQSINIQSLPTVDVGPDTTACKNNPLININAQVNGASGGLWVGDGGTFNPSNNFLNVTYDPTPSEITAGSSELILTTTGNGLCPSQNDTIIITYIDGPTVDAGPAISVCKDTTEIPLNGTAQFENGVLWTTSGNGTFVQDDTLITSYIPTQQDTANGSVTLYLETTMNGFCVAALDSVLVSFFDPPTVNITSDDTICAGQPVTLNANSTTGNGYWETLGDGFFVPNDTGNVIVYEHGTNDEGAGGVSIIFHSLNNGGCKTVLDTFALNIIPSPEAEFLFDSVCNGNATNFVDQSASVEPIISWEWDFNNGENSSTQQNPSYAFNNPGINPTTLIVTSANDCTDTLTKDIQVHFLPVAGFEVPAPCLEGGTQYYDTSYVDSAEIVTWEWNFGDNQSSTEMDPLHQYDAAGSYAVDLLVISEFGCRDSISVPVEIYPGPNAAFGVDPSSVYLNDDVNFTDQTDTDFPIVDWFWDFGDSQGTDNVQNPTYSYDDKGEYNPILIVTDENGCVDTAENIVYVFLPPQIPNAFSPNGDGANDVLSVLGGPYTQLNFVIYNNWGEIIFQSDAQSYGWDGKFKGKDQPIGVYAYTVEAVTIDGEVYTLSGDVTLLR